MIKPTMSHAVDKKHYDELLIEYWDFRENELLAKIGELELKIQSNILDDGNRGFGNSDYDD